MPRQNISLRQKWQHISPNIRLAVIFAGAMFVWMLSGPLLRSFTPAEVVSESKDTLKHVFAEVFQQQNYRQIVTLHGTTTYDTYAVIRARSEGVVEKIYLDAGAQADEGAPLADIDHAIKAAEANAAAARLKQAQIQYNALEELSKKGLRAQTELAEGEAVLAQARAQAKLAEKLAAAAQAQMPFDGIVDQRHVNPGDFVRVGDPLYTVFQPSPLLVTAFASQRERTLLEAGQLTTARLSGGQQVEGVLRSIASIADPHTRTFKVETVLTPSSGTTIATAVGGLSTELKIPTRTVQAHFVPHAVLVLGAEDALGVIRVEHRETEGDVYVAHFTPITLLEDTADGVWVTGLSSEATIITRGQAGVQDAQRVHASIKSRTSEEGATKL